MSNPKQKNQESKAQLTETGTRDDVLEELPIGICRSDLKGTIKYVNRHFMEVTGYNRDEIIGRNALKSDFFPDDMRSNLLKRIAARIGGAEPKRLDTRFKCKDGTWIWVTLEGTIIRKSGVPVGFQITASDITEHKQAEEATAESEAKYRNLVERSNDGVLIIQDGIVEFINIRLAEMWGGNKTEILGTKFITYVHPSELSKVADRYRRRISGEQVSPIYETMLLRKDGSTLYVELNAGVITYQGKPADLVLVRDINDRKLAEAEIAGQNKFHQLRAELWKIANDPYNTESELIQKILNKIGPELDVSRATFVRFKPERKEYIVESQWYTQAAGPSPTQSFSYQIARQLFGKQYAELPKDLVPGIKQYVTQRFKKNNIFSYLVVPFGDPKKPEGLFTFSECRQPRQWTQTEINTLLEVVNIITLKSEEIRTHRRISESEARFSAFMDNLPITAFIADPNHRYLYFNQEMRKAFNTEDWLGKTVDDIFPPDIAGKLKKADLEAFKKGYGVNIHTVPDKQGHERIWETHTFRIDRKDQESLMGGFSLDITDRKKSEENVLYQAMLLRSVTDAIISANKNFNITSWNKSAEKIYGWQAAEVIGKNFHDIVKPEYPYSSREEFNKKFTEDGFWSGEIVHHHKDGHPVSVYSNVSDVKDSNGSSIGRVSVNHDISAQKKAEAEKIALEDQLLQSQKMEAVGTLAGGVAHDFNNLLTVIQGHAQLMMMDITESDPNYRELRQIVNASTRAANLTRQLLLFSRKEAMEFKPVNLNQTVGNLQKMLQRLIGEDIQIDTFLTADPWQVNADEGNLEQVIMNMTVNARDAMTQGGKVTIKTENIVLSKAESKIISESYSGRFVRLSIEDTGVGISAETIDKIFEPFYSTKEVGKGTGLGLSVVYGIVKKHNGWINVYSEPGQGTIFKIYLPAITVKDQKTEKKISGFQDLTGRGERILLIEDEEGVRNFAVAALRQNGYLTFEAENAVGALEIFKNEKGRFDLILSDVVLPDQNGFQVVGELLAIHGNIPVIMCSGYTEERIKQSIIQEKGFQFLQKPYSVSSLLEVVKEAIVESE